MAHFEKLLFCSQGTFKWFLHADGEGITFGLTTNLLCGMHLWHLNAGSSDTPVALVNNVFLLGLDLQESYKRRKHRLKNTADIDILVTSTNSDRKIMQSITITCRPPLRITKWNQFSQFRWTSSKVIPIKKIEASHTLMLSQWFKRGSNWRTNNPAYPFLQLIQQFLVATRSTNSDMTTTFYTWSYGRFIEIEQTQEKEMS